MSSASTIIDNAQATALLYANTTDAMTQAARTYADNLNGSWSPMNQHPSFATLAPFDGTIEIGSQPDFADSFATPVNGATSPAGRYLSITLPPEFMPVTMPADLDTSKLFLTPKPVFDVAAFSVDAPELATVPEVRTVSYPDAPAALDGAELFKTDRPVFDVSADATRPDYALPSVPTLPEFPAAPEALDYSQLFTTPKPAWDLAALAVDAPSVKTDYTLPTAPDIAYPDAPDVRNPLLPASPDLSLTHFDQTFDAVAPDAPDAAAQLRAVFERSVPEFQAFVLDGVQAWVNQFAPDLDPLLARLDAKITAYFDRGQVLPDGIEQQIFDRARSRVLAEAEATRQEVTRNMAKRGYVLPPGALAAGLVQIQAAASDRIASAAAEVAIERAKIEIQHFQFISNLLSQVRMALLPVQVQVAQTLLQVNGQSLEYAKATAQVLLDVFNAGVQLYQARAQTFQTLAQVYEITIKGELARLDLFRAELDAAKTAIEVDQTRVQLYTALIQAQTAKIEVYSQEVKALEIEANLERVKIELYRDQVQAYATLVQSKEGEFNAYRAAIAGDSAIVEANVARVNAFATETSAAKTQVEAAATISQAQVTINDGLMKQLGTDLDAIRTRVTAKQAEADIFRALLEGDVAVVDAHGKQVTAYAQQVGAEKTKTDADVARAELVIAANKTLVEEYKTLADAYQTLIQAKATEFQGYKTAIDGDLAIVQAYSEEVKASGVKADIEKAKAQTALATTQAEIEYNRNLSQVYLAELDAFKTEVQAESMRFGGSVDAFKARLQGYINTLEAQKVQVTTQLSAQQMDLDKAKSEFDGKMRLRLADAEILMKKADAGTHAATNGASTAGHIASAAMSSVNGIASIAATE